MKNQVGIFSVVHSTMTPYGFEDILLMQRNLLYSKVHQKMKPGLKTLIAGISLFILGGFGYFLKKNVTSAEFHAK